MRLDPHRSAPCFLALLLGCVNEPTPSRAWAPEFVRQWGGTTGAGAVFYTPSLLAVSPDGFLFVADPGQGEIEKYTTGGQFMLEFDIPEGSFGPPFVHGLAADAGRLYVVNQDGTLHVLDDQGRPLGQWKAPCTDGGLAVDANGDLWVAGPFGLRRYSADGNLLDTWDIGPGAIALDPKGGVFVGQEFDMGGSRQFAVKHYTSAGALDGEWRVKGEEDVVCSQIAASAEGDVFVANWLGTISRYDRVGHLLARWSEVSPSHEPLKRVGGIAVSPAGIFVTDYVHDRVVQYR